MGGGESGGAAAGGKIKVGSLRVLGHAFQVKAVTSRVKGTMVGRFSPLLASWFADSTESHSLVQRSATGRESGHPRLLDTRCIP